MGIETRFAVLVVSCDKYSDLWRPFSELFWRFWPDCPFNIYLLCNKARVDLPRMKGIQVGEDTTWSDNLRKCLSLLEEDYVLLFIEDLFLHDFVKTDKVLKVFRWIEESKANCVKMNPVPGPDAKYNDLVGVIPKGAIYRTSTVMTVWKKSTLFELLDPAENAWYFEVHGSVRSDSYDGFYSTREVLFPVMNTVIKSKWQRRAVRKMKSLGVNIDLTSRMVMTPAEQMVFYFKRLRTHILYLLPARYRRAVKDFILQGKYNYRPTE